MKIWLGFVIVGTAACGGTDMGDDVIDPPANVSALERCVLDGGSLKELWSVSNQHGPVRSIVASSLVVLGSQDGSVKQWSVDGDEPGYGEPFARSGAPAVALALSTEHILAATEQGEVAEWNLGDASPMRTTTIADVTLAALGLSDDAARVVTGTTNGDLFVIERATGAKTELTTSLWGVGAIAYAPGNRLYTAGHWYGQPQVERRIADAPAEASDVWLDKARSGHVNAIAIDTAARHLVAAGDGFVATFAPDSIAAGPSAITDAEDHTAVGAVMLPGGALFVTAGSEGTLRVWNAETATLVKTLSIAAPIGVAVDTSGTRLYTSGADGRLHAFGCN